MEGLNRMDKHLRVITEHHIRKTLAALKANNMDGYYVQTPDELHRLLDTLIRDGETLSVGGSETLFHTGTIDYLRGRDVHFLDRYEPGLTPEQLEAIRIGAFTADTYITSSNAITEKGELYNVDGRGNRVAAMIYGPKQVIVIAGANKLVSDLDEADLRIRTVAAPANNERLSTGNPCTKTGYCADCRLDSRICSAYVVLAHQAAKGRIKVILLPDGYGY